MLGCCTPRIRSLPGRCAVAIASFNQRNRRRYCHSEYDDCHAALCDHQSQYLIAADRRRVYGFIALRSVVATPNGLSESCGGTIRAIGGSSSISIANATLPANSSCSLTIKVLGTTVGTKNNPVTVTSNEGGTGNTSTAQVVVIAMPAPTISIAFGSSSIALYASTSLTFTISNPNASPLTAVSFTDSLPSGLVVATPSGLSGSCGGGAITAVSGGSSVSLVGAALAASSSCNFSIKVTGATAGVKNNTTGAITSNESGSGATSNTATLTVNPAYSAPTVTSIGPNAGPTTGGTSVTITGSNFTGATMVKFGSTAATSFTVNSATQITAISPAGNGKVDVTVTIPGGSSAISSAGQFSYALPAEAAPTVTSVGPNAGPTTGGTSVTITGSNLTGATMVRFGSTAARSFTVNSATQITAISPAGNGKVDVIVTTPGGSSASGSADQFSYTIPADSLKVRALQNAISPVVAQTSGQVITSAVDGAIGNAFSSGGNPVTVAPNGVTFNFAEEPPPDPRTEKAYAGLGQVIKRNDPASRVAPDREWSAWIDLQGTGWTQNNSAADWHGNQLNMTAGLGRKLTPDFLIGLVTGYEHFKYDVASLAGTLKGDGGTVGGYAAWRFTRELRWDAALAWSDIAYDATAGTATGSFTGHRWLVSTGLTGSYNVAAYILEPSSKVYVLWERESEWTDSLGTLQPERNFSAGRVATGGKLIYPWVSGDMRVAPYLGLYGDYRFQTDTALPAGQPIVGIGTGLSGRVTSGISWTWHGGGTLAVGAEYGGLGADYKVWTANGRATWPF